MDSGLQTLKEYGYISIREFFSQQSCRYMEKNYRQ